MKTYLHLGVHKTASTLLQKSIQISKTKESGVYPIVRDTHYILTNTLRKYLKGTLEVEAAKRLYDKVTKDAKTQNASSILLSDENLLGDPASIHIKRNNPTLFYPNLRNRLDNLKRVIGNDFHTVIYTRQQETLFRSLYLDGLKYFRYHYSLEEFTAQCLNANFRFDKLAMNFDSQKLTLIPFESIKEGTNSFVKNFWEAIGHGDCGITPAVATLNKAIPDIQANLCRKISVLSLNKEKKNELRKWLSTMPELPTTESKIVLSPTVIQSIRDHYKDDITYQ